MRVQSSCATTDGVSSSAMSTHGVSRSCEQVARAALLVAQVHAQAAGDVVQVALALVQVRILDVVEDCGELVERALHRPLGVDALLADDGRRAADAASGRRASAAARRRWRRGRRRAARRSARGSAGAARASARAPARAPTARARRGPGAIGKRMTCVRWMATSAGPTAMPAETPIPFRRSTIPHRIRIRPAAPARRPRRPRPARRRVIVSVVPRAAASSRMPMMLLPSITFDVARRRGSAT